MTKTTEQIRAENGLELDDKKHFAQAVAWWADGEKMEHWNKTADEWYGRCISGPPAQGGTYRPKPAPDLHAPFRDAQDRGEPVWIHWANGGRELRYDLDFSLPPERYSLADPTAPPDPHQKFRDAEARGEVVEWRGFDGQWNAFAEWKSTRPHIMKTTWEYCGKPESYRIKPPAPHYVQWTGETFPAERVVTVRRKGTTGSGLEIARWDYYGVIVHDAVGDHKRVKYAELLADYEQTNGTPCGCGTLEA